MIEWLFNPWVIIIVVVAVVIGNIAALKHTANMKFNQEDNVRSRKHELDRLNELDKQKYGDDDKDIKKGP
ncbi:MULTISPECIES: DUF2897 family protein [Vibrio]|jgi:hypothetical protein|uniref:DUF2897 domain-containing protein n=1 Tax=Vibrio mediterranei TaxID=689 RepID=A0AAJ3BPK0_9VIBR|nr:MULTISPECIES: DUF2897 family protein [Vibrio]ASI88806.1 hypothetical protein BSZ05_02630 [Vibrio mediterranei]KFA97214.1 hypothetical protein HW45_15370 [Vibrio sp. ER1A]MCG9624724.1 DUF2897 family protein [Vibrio mediterranei]MCG9656054.1 DUF2897 family protein [Vibrio mediterranei]MCG9665738.1 DUF2897 family protein [Vibrio mediterranei]